MVIVREVVILTLENHEHFDVLQVSLITVET